MQKQERKKEHRKFAAISGVFLTTMAISIMYVSLTLIGKKSTSVSARHCTQILNSPNENNNTAQEKNKKENRIVKNNNNKYSNSNLSTSHKHTLVDLEGLWMLISSGMSLGGCKP